MVFKNSQIEIEMEKVSDEIVQLYLRSFYTGNYEEIYELDIDKYSLAKQDIEPTSIASLASSYNKYVGRDIVLDLSKLIKSLLLTGSRLCVSQLHTSIHVIPQLLHLLAF